jgi:hypothetical protein
MHNINETKQLRDFGLIVGGIFLLIGCWPIVFGAGHPRWWSVIVGGSLFTTGAIMPTVLGPIYRGWMFVGHILGWINTRILLTVIFYGLITPMGMIRRLMGRNTMGYQFEPQSNTYRVFRQPRPSSHMKQLF